MRKRYSRKRKLRRMSRRKRIVRRKLRGDPMRFVGRSKIPRKVKNTFKKALSSKKYDTAVFKTVGQWASGVAYWDATNMVPLSASLGLSGTGSGQTPALTAYDLAKTFQYKLARYAEFYTQYRVKYIRFEFIPATALYKVVNANTYVYNTGAPGGSVQSVPSTRDVCLMVAWPPKGTLQAANTTAALGIGGGTLFGGDPQQDLPNVIASNMSTVKKIPMQSTISMAWKPRIFGYKTSLFTPLNGAISSADTQAARNSTTMPYPWSNFIDNAVTIANPPALGNYNSTSLRMPMTQPYTALYEVGTGTFPTQPGGSNSGRWELSAVFEFRGKRGDAALIGPIAENITSTTVSLQP